MNIKTPQVPVPPYSPSFEAVAWSDSARICPCCDGEAHVILGGIFSQNEVRAVYLLSWTRGRTQHAPHIDLILGPWGPGSQASARVLITLAYRPKPQGGKFIQIDSMTRLANSSIYCGHALGADEGLPPPFDGELPLCVEAIWESEPFVNESLPASSYSCGRGQG